MKKLNIFPFAVFAGAFLLFQIQPLIGKYFLPWFGGTPAVWMTCLMFFQLLLLGGYAYAHGLQRFSPRRQVQIHLSLLCIAVLTGGVLFFLWGSPILPPLSWKLSQGDWPAWSVFRLLLISIGLSYFLLSTSASLLQAWFHQVEPNKSPYVFYIVSNTASLLALLSYPVLIEPFFTLKTQALLWSGGFFAYVVLCLLSARHVWPLLTAESEEHKSNPTDKPYWKTSLLWTTLAACGVLALMAITNQMTQDIPPVPFLWILPLVLYLLSYIIAFMDRFRDWQDYYIFLLICAGLAAFYLLDQGLELAIGKQIAGYGFILFSICLFCHNALYRRKPEPRQLTHFYLCLSLGGVLGGVFVAVLAPRLFTQYWEYQLAIVLAALLAVISIYSEKRSIFYKTRHLLWIAVPVLAFFISEKEIQRAKQSVYRDRSFFGSVRVELEHNSGIPIYSLMHGKINHGMQIHHPKFINRPTTYFARDSGCGLAIINHSKYRRKEPMDVGLVGMGIGVLSAYGREGDNYRFYEIDPAVIRLATDSPWFSYLKNSQANISIVEGDGRLSLKSELQTSGSHYYDLLVIDVFSGDQIPAHILTLEAFNLYLTHLEKDGVIAVNISNRYLDLLPVLNQVANHFDLHAAYIKSEGDKKITANAQWVLLSRNEEFIQQPAIIRVNSLKKSGVKTIRPWTDDYSNLLDVLK